MAKPNEWKPPTAAEVTHRWRQCVDDMLEVRRNFWLNHSYFHDNQWIAWNDASSQVDVLDFSAPDDAQYRATVNKLKPHTVAMVARLVRTPLSFEPRPQGVDSGALRISRIERQVLEAKHHYNDWEQVRSSEVLAAILGGVSAVCVEPDWQFKNQSTTDAQTGETIRLPERPLPRLTALSAVEFGLEPGTRLASEASWWIRLTTLTPRQAKARYKLDEEPTPDADQATSPMHRQLLSARAPGRRQGRTATAVYVYYERPHGDSPGCVLHVINGKVVEQTPWPFPFTDRLNLRVFVQTPVDGTWQGDTMFNSARSLQRFYNLVQTSINRHIGKADNARILLPMGSVIDGEDEFTGEAAEIIRYDPNAGAPPSWMQAPQVPRWLREQKEDYSAELDELFSRHSVSRGVAPGDRNSGTALAILAEKDETPLGLFVGDQQRGWQALAEMVLMLERHLLELANKQMAAAGLTDEMSVTDVLPAKSGRETAEQVEYRAVDLSECPNVHIPIEAVRPVSQIAVQDQMVRLAGVFPQLFQQLDAPSLAAVLQVPDQAAFAYVPDYHVSLAEWENGRMLLGVDDDEVQVDAWHDHEKHIERHNAARASARYREAPPEVQQYIDTHVDAHAKLYQDQQMAMMQQQMQQAAQAAMPPGAPVEAGPPMGGPQFPVNDAGAPQPQGVPA